MKAASQTYEMLKPRIDFIFPQWLAGAGVFLVMVELGFMGGCTSPMLTKLMAADSPIRLNPDQASWFASLVNIGRFLGALIGSTATSFLGTKRTIFITLFPIALGWLGIILANTFEILYAARISSGIGVGMAFSSFPLYLGEIAIPNIRGSLVSFGVLGAPVGQLLGSIASTYLDSIGSSSIYLGITLFLMVIFFFLPESPHHLIKIQDQTAAKKSIGWYRSGRKVDEEFDAVTKFVASDSSIKFIDRLREFRNPGTRRATYQVMILFVFMQINGLNSIVYYLEIIFKNARFNLISTSEMVIYTNICAAASTILSIFLIDRCGRKFLLLISSSGVSVALLMLSIHFILIDINIDVTNLQWLPGLSVILYMLFFYIGLIAIPSTIMSETIPPNVKSIVACIGSFTAGIIAFLSSKTYQPMVDVMGESYVFLTYTLLTVIVIPYAIFVLRETKGKSLQQIQDELMK